MAKLPRDVLHGQPHFKKPQDALREPVAEPHECANPESGEHIVLILLVSPPDDCGRPGERYTRWTLIRDAMTDWRTTARCCVLMLFGSLSVGGLVVLATWLARVG